MKKGKIIVLEGLDYSFKETNSKSLYEYIKENITDKVKLVSFPNYDSYSSIFIKKYLNGDYGKSSDVDPYQTSVLYTVDRLVTFFEDELFKLYNEGYYLIFDRYITSNLLFQTSKIDGIEEQNKYLNWMTTLEKTLGLPQPDVVIYMDMPLECSYPLIQEREHKTNTTKDGHEDNYTFLKNVHDTAYRVCDIYKWKIVKCVYPDNTIKPKNIIFKEILERLNL